MDNRSAPVVSLGEWIITFIVLAIPLVNIIMLFVWAFSGGTNPNKQNFCKATLIVYLVGIVLFWIVHVMPEKIAEKRHHPQKEAIHTLCLLSLVFGGLLWPIAWLWAYTKPVGYRLAYGTEKHDNYYLELGEKAKSGALLQEDIAHLQHELDAMAAKGTLPANLKTLRGELAALRIEPTAGAKAAGA